MYIGIAIACSAPASEASSAASGGAAPSEGEGTPASLETGESVVAESVVAESVVEESDAEAGAASSGGIEASTEDEGAVELEVPHATSAAHAKREPGDRSIEER